LPVEALQNLAILSITK